MLLILSTTAGSNLELGRKVEEAAERKGIPASVLDLSELRIPLFCMRDFEAGPGADYPQLHQQILDADALWIAAPEYNGSTPPNLTSAIAWMSTTGDDFREMFAGLPVALSTHSGGGGQKVLSAMRMQFSHLGATVIGRELLTTKTKEANPDSIDAMLGMLQKLMD